MFLMKFVHMNMVGSHDVEFFLMFLMDEI